MRVGCVHVYMNRPRSPRHCTSDSSETESLEFTANSAERVVHRIPVYAQPLRGQRLVEVRCHEGGEDAPVERPEQRVNAFERQPIVWRDVGLANSLGEISDISVTARLHSDGDVRRPPGLAPEPVSRFSCESCPHKSGRGGSVSPNTTLQFGQMEGERRLKFVGVRTAVGANDRAKNPEAPVVAPPRALCGCRRGAPTPKVGDNASQGPDADDDTRSAEIAMELSRVSTRIGQKVPLSLLELGLRQTARVNPRLLPGLDAQAKVAPDRVAGHAEATGELLDGVAEPGSVSNGIDPSAFEHGPSEVLHERPGRGPQKCPRHRRRGGVSFSGR